jgi:drug/metabolite transporter (DMT)-like permease
MTRWALKEPLGTREFLAVGLVALGIVMVSLTPPSLDSVPPAFGEWAAVVAILGPAVLLPYVLRISGRLVSPSLGAISSGLAYAMNGVFSKGISETVSSSWTLPLVLLLGGAILTGLLGFEVELDALKYGRASVVASIVLALHTVVPIACAPFIFGEAWPAGLLPRVLLGTGISLTLLGTLLLSNSSSRVAAEA